MATPFSYIDLKTLEQVFPKVLHSITLHGTEWVVHLYGALRAGKKVYTMAHRETGFSVLSQSTLPTTPKGALTLGRLALESRTKEQVDAATAKARVLNNKAFATVLAKQGGAPRD